MTHLVKEENEHGSEDIAIYPVTTLQGDWPDCQPDQQLICTGRCSTQSGTGLFRIKEWKYEAQHNTCFHFEALHII